MKTSKKIKIIAIGVIGFSIICAILSYFIRTNEWSWPNLLLSISVSLLQLFLAIIIVNVYLTNSQNKDLNTACFFIINDSIADYHNHYLDLVFNKFGKDGYIKLTKEYINNSRDPKSLAKKKVIEYIDAIKEDFDKLLQEVYHCSETLLQASMAGAFNGNPDFLTLSLESIRLKGRIEKADITNPEQYRTIFELLVDFDDTTQSLRQAVLKSTQIKLDELGK